MIHPNIFLAMKKKILTLVLLFTSCFALGQETTNVQAQFDVNKQKINIFYDLEAVEGQKFEVSVYCSFNNYAMPLVFVSGDVGKKVTAGLRKKIVWDYKRETDNELAALDFDIRAVRSEPAEVVEEVQSYSGVKTGFVFIAEAGIKYGKTIAPSMSGVLGYQGERLSIGIGVGFDGDYGAGPFIPLFIDGRIYFLTQPSSPFIGVNIGFSPGEGGGLLAGASLGYRFGKFLINIGGQYSANKKQFTDTFTNTSGTEQYDERLPLTQIVLTTKIGFVF